MPSNYIKFDRIDIQTIIGSIDEIEPKDRTDREQQVLNKAREILSLMKSSSERERPTLFIDPDSARLTITYGDSVSEPVPYNGIARLANYFAVTDFYEGIFPTNVLLRFTHVEREDRLSFEASDKSKDKSKDDNEIRRKRGSNK